MEIKIGEQTYAGNHDERFSGNPVAAPGGVSAKVCRGAHMLGTITWIVAVILGVIALTIAFIINARTLTRDLKQRRDTFRTHLENEANAMIDHLLETERRREERPPL